VTFDPSDPVAAENRVLALKIAEIISDTPAVNTLVIDIQRLSSFADFFIICSGENPRQLRAIALAVQERLDEQGVRPKRSEGSPESGWILIDYGDIIIHVFDVEQREYYRLETLWAEAPTLLAIQ
jgi:ribosome-associated protein